MYLLSSVIATAGSSSCSCPYPHVASTRLPETDPLGTNDHQLADFSKTSTTRIFYTGDMYLQ